MSTHGERPGLFAQIRMHRDALLTTLAVLMASTVAFVTGQASWQHIVHVGRMVYEPSAAWLPVAIDGMVVTGTLMAARDRLRGYKPSFWAIVALWWGAALTLTFNLASAWARGIWAMVVAVLFATAFIVSVEAVMRPSTRLLKEHMRSAKESKTDPVVVPEVAPDTAELASKGEPVKPPAPRQRGRKPGPQTPPSKRRAQPHTTLGPVPAPTPKPEPVKPAESDVIKATVVEGPAPAPRDAIAAAPMFREPAPVVVTETEIHDKVTS